MYKGILKLAGEPQLTIEDLMEVKSTGISIERFEKYLRLSRLKIVARRLYLFNPIYSYKFNVKPRLQSGWIAHLPVIRNFLTTGVYYIVKA